MNSRPRMAVSRPSSWRNGGYGRRKRVGAWKKKWLGCVFHGDSEPKSGNLKPLPKKSHSRALREEDSALILALLMSECDKSWISKSSRISKNHLLDLFLAFYIACWPCLYSSFSRRSHQRLPFIQIQRPSDSAFDSWPHDVLKIWVGWSANSQ